MMLIVFVRTVVASAETDAASPLVSYLATVTAIAGVTSLVAGIVWGLWHRNNYDRQNKTIAEQEKLLDTRDRAIADLEKDVARLKKAIEALEAARELDRKNCEAEIGEIKAMAKAVTMVNIVALAELKVLREKGVWGGNEEDIFTLAGLKKEDDR